MRLGISLAAFAAIAITASTGTGTPRVHNTPWRIKHATVGTPIPSPTPVP